MNLNLFIKISKISSLQIKNNIERIVFDLFIKRFLNFLFNKGLRSLTVSVLVSFRFDSKIKN